MLSLYLYIPTGEANWVLVATGIADCYYNVTDLPVGGTYKFRVSCVNKAGQGPYSCCSTPITLPGTGNRDGIFFFIILKEIRCSLTHNHQEGEIDY